MLDAQRQLPWGASPGQRLVALLAQCPTLHKLGQVVARHRDIPAHVRRELHVLESPPATTPVAELLARVRGELSPDAPVTIASEVRLQVEQANMAAAARLYAGEARIQVPQLLPWCTARMTAMERVRGTHVADARLPPGVRERLAESMVTGLLARPFWSRGEEALIHADPHAGNLVATHDGRLAVLDWSLAARLSKAQREALVD